MLLSIAGNREKGRLPPKKPIPALHHSDTGIYKHMFPKPPWELARKNYADRLYGSHLKGGILYALPPPLRGGEEMDHRSGQREGKQELGPTGGLCYVVLL